jgi:hypothetical protein
MSKILTAIVIIGLLAGNFFFYFKSKSKEPAPKPMATTLPSSNPNAAPPSSPVNYLAAAYEMSTEVNKVRNNLRALKAYAAVNKCNTNFAFIADMRISILKKRFFVCDLRTEKIIDTAFVAHGIGSETFRGELTFSNIPDSRSTSLGKYKIGNSYVGDFGFSYRLHGLDSTNNNAFRRAIVLHAHSSVPDRETNFPICLSYGCPMVSKNFMQVLKGYISKQGKTPMLLSIIY